MSEPNVQSEREAFEAALREGFGPPVAERALRAVIAHWDEFGPEHGFDELIDQARRAALESRAPIPAQAGEREALAGLEVLYLREGESWNDCFERVGELFHKDTGYLRPGKDYGALSGFSDEQGRSEAWDKWIAAKVAAARAALASRAATAVPAELSEVEALARALEDIQGLSAIDGTTVDRAAKVLRRQASADSDAFLTYKAKRWGAAPAPVGVPGNPEVDSSVHPTEPSVERPEAVDGGSGSGSGQ